MLTSPKQIHHRTSRNDQENEYCFPKILWDFLLVLQTGKYEGLEIR